GMCDLLTLLLAIALAFTALGVISVIQYNVQMNNMPEGLTDYEIRESLGYFARSRGSFLAYGLSLLIAAAAGFVILAITSYLRDKVSYGTKNRSEEHTSELQSRENLVCRLLL